MKRDKSDQILRRAEQVMPGGVSSPVRAFKSVGGAPVVMARGEGAFALDVDGNQYIDYQMSFGPLLFGHAPSFVVEAIQQAAANGTTFGAPTPDETHLAEEVTFRHPSAKWLRFVNSGTEALMSAIRLARAFTGRHKILKFDGCYHGHADALLVKGGSGLATFGIATSAGVPPDAVKDTAVLPLDDEHALDAFFDRHGDELACAVIEAVPANAGLLLQRRDFLHKLEKRCRDHGALFIVDEVITGFRLGWAGAAGHYGLRPDLVTFGKIIGGGLPVGAYGGREDLMTLVAPLGPMYQAGTLSGNPLAMAAGLATLKALGKHPAPWQTLELKTAHLARELEHVLRASGVPAQVPHAGSIFWIYLSDQETPRRLDAVDTQAVERFRRLHRSLLAHGVFYPPSAYEVGFMSLAHDDAALEDTVAATRHAAQEAFQS